MKRWATLLVGAAGAFGVACSLTTDFASLTSGGPIVAGTDGGGEAGPGVVFEAGSDGAVDGAAAACTAPGERCPDGTVYVIQRNGGTIYTTPCDLGQTSANGLCTGSRELLPYNNGNSGGGAFANATSSDDGASDTAKLVTADADSDSPGMQPHRAAKACSDLVYGGHDDWYLPAIIELNELYLAKAVLGGFDEGDAYYKSSTETHDAFEPLNAAVERFGDGYQYSDGNTKPQPGAVRCTRFVP